MNLNRDYAGLLKKLEDHSRAQPDISALALIGSRSAEAQRADEYSDLDLLLVTANVGRYFSQADWLSAIGDCWLSFTESVPDAAFYERRALFAQGFELDIVLVDQALLRQGPEKLPIAREICRGGLEPILDKANLTPALSALVNPAPAFQFPSQEEFTNAVNEFFFHCVWARKKLLRGERWVAYRCVNAHLKSLLLRLLEWLMRARHGADYDTRYDGRYLDTWLDSDLQPDLRASFSAYEAADISEALAATESLFTRVARETAQRLGFTFPERGAAAIAEWGRAHPL
jgi:aminoglycoside 6-adenylyltransferase